MGWFVAAFPVAAAVSVQPNSPTMVCRALIGVEYLGYSC